MKGSLTRDIFCRPFESLAQKLAQLSLALPIKQDLLARCNRLQVEAERLATLDEMTYTLNRRGEAWYVNEDQVLSIAKIDLYDMRQANQVYGLIAVDNELRRLAYRLQEVFHSATGNYIRRATGSDEFKVMSTTKTVAELQELLHTLHQQDKGKALIPWDFGVGETESEAEQRLQRLRKRIRPTIIRRMNPEHEMLKTFSLNEIGKSYQEFQRPYCALISKLAQTEIPPTILKQLVAEVGRLQTSVESVIVADPLTGVLNSIGERWYVKPVQANMTAIALTDMQNMHEANLRYGPAAVDQDLSRFASVLLAEFRREDGFFVARLGRAGDEFKIVACGPAPENLRQRLARVHQQDYGRGLLVWHAGVGTNEIEAHYNLHQNISLPIPNHSFGIKPMETSTVYLVAKFKENEHQDAYDYVKRISASCGGLPVDDLHCTLQSIRGIAKSNLESLLNRIQAYLQKIRGFEIRMTSLARVSSSSTNNGGYDRIWLLVERQKHIKSIYHGIANIAQDLGLQSYPYPVDEWTPHIKGVILSSQTPPMEANSLYGSALNLTLKIQYIEATSLVSPNNWQTIRRFELIP